MRANGKHMGVRGCGVAHKVAVKFGNDRNRGPVAARKKRLWAKRVRRDALAGEDVCPTPNAACGSW